MEYWDENKIAKYKRGNGYHAAEIPPFPSRLHLPTQTPDSFFNSRSLGRQIVQFIRLIMNKEGFLLLLLP